MGYQNGKNVLPEELICQIQKYIDGACIYIPRREEKRKKWGENTVTKSQIAERNREIYEKYQAGVSVRRLSEKYYISTQGIYKIIASEKNFRA